MSACFCDYDPPEFYAQVVRSSRKPRKCEECRRPILIGERYENASGKWGGSFDTFYTCEDCVSLRQWVVAHVPCCCWSHGNLHEDLHNTADEYRSTPGLLFGFLRRLIRIRRKATNMREAKE